jgi:hypothetical protein
MGRTIRNVPYWIKKGRRDKRRRGYGEESRREEKAGVNPPTSRAAECADLPSRTLIQIKVAKILLRGEAL